MEEFTTCALSRDAMLKEDLAFTKTRTLECRPLVVEVDEEVGRLVDHKSENHHVANVRWSRSRVKIIHRLLPDAGLPV